MPGGVVREPAGAAGLLATEGVVTQRRVLVRLTANGAGLARVRARLRFLMQLLLSFLAGLALGYVLCGISWVQTCSTRVSGDGDAVTT
jgi:hypothetical protein